MAKAKKAASKKRASKKVSKKTSKKKVVKKVAKKTAVKKTAAAPKADWESVAKAIVAINATLYNIEKRLDGVLGEGIPATNDTDTPDLFGAVTKEEVTQALQEGVTKHGHPKVSEILEKYGANNVSTIKESDYGAVLTDCKNLVMEAANSSTSTSGADFEL